MLIILQSDENLFTAPNGWSLLVVFLYFFTLKVAFLLQVNLLTNQLFTSEAMERTSAVSFVLVMRIE